MFFFHRVQCVTVINIILSIYLSFILCPYPLVVSCRVRAKWDVKFHENIILTFLSYFNALHQALEAFITTAFASFE